MDRDSKSTDPSNIPTFNDIPAVPPYIKHLDPILDEFGLEQKNIT